MKNIENLYTSDVGMSEEPIFSYTFLEYVTCSTKVVGPYRNGRMLDRKAWLITMLDYEVYV
jgi:hypothetical protein